MILHHLRHPVGEKRADHVRVRLQQLDDVGVLRGLDDAIDVVASGGAVEVQGLATVVRTIGADPTLDTLSVFGMPGDDSITATPEAAALMLISTFP